MTSGGQGAGILHARQKLLLADSSKYHAWSLYRIADLDQFSAIITDSRLVADVVRMLKRKQVNVVVV